MHLAQALAVMSITPVLPSEFSACRDEMGASHRDGAQAGGCPLLVPPEDGGGREQKAAVLYSSLCSSMGAPGTR